MPQPKRKPVRLKGYDYSTEGAYFITVCTKGKEKLLCEIVGTAVLGGPQIRLTDCGHLVERRLREMSDFYEDVKIEKYVVMPNHVHLILHILNQETKPPEIADGPPRTAERAGPPRTAVPTSKVSRFIGTFKSLCTREIGRSIWQGRSYDHIIRDEQDYLRIWSYIDQNPAKWREDRFYIPEIDQEK